MVYLSSLNTFSDENINLKSWCSIICNFRWIFRITNALVAEFIGVKIFALEPTLGLETNELEPIWSIWIIDVYGWSIIVADCFYHDGCDQ